MHQCRLKTVKAMDKQLNQKERLKWYEVVGSCLDHSKEDIIRERSGMPAGYDLALPKVEDRANSPPWVYHNFYTKQIDMFLRFPIPKTIQIMRIL